MARLIFDESVLFPGGSANGAVQNLDVDLPRPEDEAPEGYYLVSVISDGQLNAPVAAQCMNRMSTSDPNSALAYNFIPVGGAIDVAASSSGSGVVQGWLIGKSPARIQVSLTGAGSAAGGRVWVMVHAIGRGGR